MPSTPIIFESDCGVLNSNQRYESEACNIQLPYICKKSVNASHEAPAGRLTACLHFHFLGTLFESPQPRWRLCEAALWAELHAKGLMQD